MGGAWRRGRLERAAAVCEACGRGGCECWRASAAQCTCSPRGGSRLAAGPRAGPVRAHSDDEARPRRLYKSASQRAICAPPEERPKPQAKPADPLLETTC
ncbi:unnamed protein product, partial [Iphiclides podalirius]